MDPSFVNAADSSQLNAYSWFFSGYFPFCYYDIVVRVVVFIYKQTRPGFAFLFYVYKKTALTFEEIFQRFIDGVRQTTLLEYIAIFAGIISVWFSRIENIWVYPIGLINTVSYVYLNLQYHLPGEASVNIYYTIMSLYGWYMWVKRDKQQQYVLHISYSTRRMLLYQAVFFLFSYAALYFSLIYLKDLFFEEAIPWADSFAAAAAFTGMWLMARKKVESWYWWIVTNIASIPLYFVKGMVMTSVYYIILFVLAIAGLIEWKKRAVPE